MYIVYKATSPSNKVYVGITRKSLKNRIGEHVSLSKSGKIRPFQCALKKYGNNFVWEVIESGLERSKAEELEKYYIKFYKSNDMQFGYNLSPGGLAGSIMSEEGKKRHKEKMRIHYDDPKYIKMLSDAKKKSLEDPDQLQIAINSIKMYWSKEENKQKRSQSTKEMWKNPDHKIKMAKALGGKEFVCVETGEIFQYLGQAAERFGSTCKDSIYKVLKGKRKTYKKLHFKYVD